MGFGAALPWGVASAASRTWVTASEVLQKASRSRLTRWGNIEYGPHGLPHGLKTPHWLFFFGWWIVMDECVNPRLPGFGSFLNLFRWYPPIIDSVKNYDVKETYRNTRFRRDSHFPLKQPDSGWNSNPSSGQIIHGICKPSTNVACQARERGLQLDTVAQNSVAWSTCAFGSRDDQLKNKKKAVCGKIYQGGIA